MDFNDKQRYSERDIRNIARDEAKKINPSSGGGKGKTFFAGILGGLLGGLLVFFLMTSTGKNDQAKETEPVNKDSKQQVVISPSDNLTMEQAVVKKSIGSVVGVTTVQKQSRNTIFGLQSGYVEGVGSGVIVSSDGYILTNSHVVNNGDTLKLNVLLYGEENPIPADLIWNDSTLDLAIIKVDRKDLPAVEMADSDKVEVGQRVVAIGNPLGLDFQFTVTSGIISGLNRTVSFETGAQMDGLMQTDAAINSGNSGGALLNSEGKLVGINTAKAGNSDGIGFAIPINTAKSVVDQVKKTGSFKSVYLGISGINMDLVKQQNGFKKDEFGTDTGIFVTDVFDKNLSSIKKGDIIVAIDDKDIKDMSTLKKTLLNYQVGDSAKITLYRNGKKQTVDFKFSLDSSNVDQYNQANPDNQRDQSNGDSDDDLFRLFP